MFTNRSISTGSANTPSSVLLFLIACLGCRSTTADEPGPAAAEQRRGVPVMEERAPVEAVDVRALRNELVMLAADRRSKVTAQDLERWRDGRSGAIESLSETDRATINGLYQSVRLQLLMAGASRGEVDMQTAYRARFVGLKACRMLASLHQKGGRDAEEEEFYQELLQRREQDLEQALPSIRTQLDRIRDEAKVDEFIDELLSIPGDSQLASAATVRDLGEKEKVRIDRWRERQVLKKRAEAEALARAQAQARAKPPSSSQSRDLSALPELPRVRGPFDELSGGDFLNALYHGDLAAVARFNKYYQVRKVRQLRGLTGEDPFGALLETGIGEIRLEENVMAVYLFRYESNFGDCLGDDAAEFEVTETRPDTVYENGLGVEVARFYGGTTKTHYRVKPEFEAAFRRVGRMKPEGGMSELSDLLLNGGGSDLRRDLLKGARQIFGRFECDSAEILRFESGLLSVFSR